MKRLNFSIEFEDDSKNVNIISKSLDAWQANCEIVNNTTYNIDMTGAGAGNTTISPNGTYKWTSTDVNNAKALRFWIEPNIYYMQGNLSFGPQSGVYVDRGWMAADDQTIEMFAIANGKEFIQKTNGGETLLAWNEFEQGGNISLTFNHI